MPNSDHSFTIDELASRWSCGRKSVVEAIRDGRLRAFRLGKRTYRVAAAEVSRFEQTMAAAS